MNRVFPDVAAAEPGGAHETWRHMRRQAARGGSMENWENGDASTFYAYARMSERRRAAAEDGRAHQARPRRVSPARTSWRLRRRVGLLLIALGHALIEPAAAPTCQGKPGY